MNNITNQYPWTGYNNQSSATDYRSLAYLREQSVSAEKLLNTDLVIQTKEGDTVTINSESFSQLDAYTYEGQAMVQTGSGTTLSSESYREISLSSGETFSFSVEGDLSEEELADIDSMLKGLDRVIADMKEGDMDGAMKNALRLGEFDTFSAYNVDIMFQQSYQMNSSTTAIAEETSTTPASGDIFTDLAKTGSMETSQLFEMFFENLVTELDTEKPELVNAARNPIHKLMDRHRDTVDENNTDAADLNKMLTKAMKKMDNFIKHLLPSD